MITYINFASSLLQLTVWMKDAFVDESPIKENEIVGHLFNALDEDKFADFKSKIRKDNSPELRVTKFFTNLKEYESKLKTFIISQISIQENDKKNEVGINVNLMKMQQQEVQKRSSNTEQLKEQLLRLVKQF